MSKGKPKVSIVIPVYNSERYLKESIESVINQTWSNIEIICINDGSIDSSLDILNEYASKDKRIRVFSKENEGKGAASARNLGLQKATGKYIIFLDSDDFFEEELVEELVGKAETTDSDVVITTAFLFDNVYQRDNGICLRPALKFAPQKEPFNYRDCPDKILQIADLVAWNKLFKRDFLIDNNICFESIPISDDQYPSVIGTVLADRISVVNRPLIHYRMNTNSGQGSSKDRHPEAAYEAVYSVVNELRSRGIYEDVKQSYLNLAIHLMRMYFDEMSSYYNIEFLYRQYKETVFPFLEASNLPEDYFYDTRVGDWYKLITEHSLSEVLFKAARAYGGSMTTAALRFQAPINEIKKGSTVAVIGKGIAGRYWYAQLILSDYCKDVIWVDSEKDLPIDMKIDSAIIAR